MKVFSCPLQLHYNKVHLDFLNAMHMTEYSCASFTHLAAHLAAHL